MPAITKVQKVMVSASYLANIFFPSIACPTDPIVAITKKILPKTWPLKLPEIIGWPMIINTPNRLIIVPISTFKCAFSCRINMANIYKKTGPEAEIIGALMEGARDNPQKKKVILMVIPEIDINISCFQSVWPINLFFGRNGRSSNEAPKNLKNAKVKGGIFCKASLKIGEAAPQMILASIKARIAWLYGFENIGQLHLSLRAPRQTRGVAIPIVFIYSYGIASSPPAGGSPQWHLIRIKNFFD